jgi:hypothetical protein
VGTVLIVADAERMAELVLALAEPLPAPHADVEVLVSSGGDDTIDLFAARRPHAVVVTATLEAGDSKALVETLRGMVGRAEVGIVLIGDDLHGPIKNALDASELAPDRFVSRPMSEKALRFAVGSVLEASMLVRATAGADPERAPVPDAHPPIHVDDEPTAAQQRARLRARWEALADSFIDVDEDAVTSKPDDEAEPLPPMLSRNRTPDPDRSVAPPQAWQPGTTAALEREASRPWALELADIIEAPTREPTLIIREAEPPVAPSADVTPLPDPPRTRTGDSDVHVAERTKAGEKWSTPMPLAELLDRDSSGEINQPPGHDELGLPLDDFDDDLVLGGETGAKRALQGRLEVFDDLPEDAPAPPAAAAAVSAAPDGRDFARQLRAKMSRMAQRLFQGGGPDQAESPAVDLGPRHDHHTEIDLASLGEEPALHSGGNTEIEARAGHRSGAIELLTSPGSWDTQVRERGLPDTGEIVRGLSDAAMLLARMFATAATGRIGFRRDDVETVVYFDQGRPVFASSSEPSDRMGELLVREGKITASQYERCQTVVAESGRRMGEILVDFGYLKRRELLPAVRRHVEDIVYALFGWDRGTYRVIPEVAPSAERIRLSRHPAALILEGVRRKLDRSTLERLLGPPSTVIEVPDRERLGGIINLGDLQAEERASLAAFDGQADLSAVARIAGIDVADVLPLAWGLCVLGLAHARRTETEVPDESSALVGETDLAIDRERVRARWQLVTEADYFALLGVRKDATAFEIRRAYQSARRDFAADGFPNDLRRELAQELDDIAHVLDEAFRVLRDDRLRLTYLANLFG